MPPNFRLLRKASRLLNRSVAPFVRATSPQSIALLKTRGRHSGREHVVILPIYLRRGNRIYLISGYRLESDWAKNILRDGTVSILLCEKVLKGRARMIDFSRFRQLLHRSAGEKLPGPRWGLALTRALVLIWARVGTVFSVTIDNPIP
ncbi:MAG: nitroreductase/quinone reductase family protein [Candidatus Thermoplasmatota archaeon]|nr:nitroreductase/quinone reductase family protein [Candidatus Thermoplasmatota archaeon]